MENLSITKSSADTVVEKSVNTKAFSQEFSTYLASADDILICDFITLEDTNFW